MSCDDIICEIERHIEDTKASKRAHFDLADYYYEKARRFNIIKSVALGVVVAWLLSTQFKGIISDGHWVVVLLPTFLSVFIASISAAETVLRFDEQFSMHFRTAQKYHSLWRCCMNWRTDVVNAGSDDNLKLLAQKFRERLNEINAESPHLSVRDWERVKKFRKAYAIKDPTQYAKGENEEMSRTS